MNGLALCRMHWPCHVLALVLVLVMTVGISGQAAAQPVKKSKSGICHCPGGQYYARTSKFTAFDSIEACLASGGRHPKRGQGQCSASGKRDPVASKTLPLPPAAKPRSKPYDRSVFGGWADADGDCQNTRHERLIDLSRSPVRFSENGCQVVQGHWYDPYTGKAHRTARDLHIDHLVPLFYAWKRGAEHWEPVKQRSFMNDSANLLAVEAGVNQDKGANGPLAWLPPRTEFHCEYLLRFARVTTRYGLQNTPAERVDLEQLTAEKCD